MGGVTEADVGFPTLRYAFTDGRERTFHFFFIEIENLEAKVKF